jgi:hypothetical protein
MKLAIVLSLLCISFISYTQAESYEYKVCPNGKLKYEFAVHKSRKHLLDDFFELFAKSKSVWIMKEDRYVAIARKNRKGFEVVGDGSGETFECEAANLCIDLWNEYAKVNSL